MLQGGNYKHNATSKSNILLWVIYTNDVDYFVQLCKDLGLTQGKSSVLLFVVKGNDHIFELGAC